MLPNDIHMLVSFLNTKLRDDDMSLEHIIEINDGIHDEIMNRINQNGYFYDTSIRQIKHK
ncbi:MAG: DUF4250 domain-containing protein [Coprobacillaceae bacterium]